MKKMMTLAAVALIVAGSTAFAGEKGECTGKKSVETACSSEKKSEGCAVKKSEGCTVKKAECTKDA